MLRNCLGKHFTRFLFKYCSIYRAVLKNQPIGPLEILYDSGFFLYNKNDRCAHRIWSVLVRCSTIRSIQTSCLFVSVNYEASKEKCKIYIYSNINYLMSFLFIYFIMYLCIYLFIH